MAQHRGVCCTCAQHACVSFLYKAFKLSLKQHQHHHHLNDSQLCHAGERTNFGWQHAQPTRIQHTASFYRDDASEHRSYSELSAMLTHTGTRTRTGKGVRRRQQQQHEAHAQFLQTPVLLIDLQAPPLLHRGALPPFLRQAAAWGVGIPQSDQGSLHFFGVLLLLC